jgi:hypothetical protein
LNVFKEAAARKGGCDKIKISLEATFLLVRFRINCIRYLDHPGNFRINPSYFDEHLSVLTHGSSVHLSLGILEVILLKSGVITESLFPYFYDDGL